MLLQKEDFFIVLPFQNKESLFIIFSQNNTIRPFLKSPSCFRYAFCFVFGIPFRNCLGFRSCQLIYSLTRQGKVKVLACNSLEGGNPKNLTFHTLLPDFRLNQEKFGAVI